MIEWQLKSTKATTTITTTNNNNTQFNITKQNKRKAESNTENNKPKAHAIK